MLKLILNRIREDILAIYSPKKYIVPEADAATIDTEIIINLPWNSIAYLTTTFKDQKIKEICGHRKRD